MRMQKLTFDFFGHFTDKILDFGPTNGTSDFHIIYGSNEAGKTTTMEGYLRLLYGFPARDPYGFQHQRANLRVSGVFNLDKTTHHFTRISARKSNLLDQSGAILPEAAITSQLGGLSLDDYRSLLCLDDETIEKGGNDIASARGDIGRLLFSAAAGVADLNAVLEQAQEEADSIYKKGGSKNRVAGLRRKLSDIEHQIKDLDINASAWRKLKESLKHAQTEETKIIDSRDFIRLELTRTTALHRVFPKIGEIDRLNSEIADYTKYPSKIDFEAEDLVELKTEQATAEAELTRLSEDIEASRKEKDKLVLDEEKLGLAARLTALEELRNRTQTAELDLPRRRIAYQDAKNDMVRIGKELGFNEKGDVTTLVKPLAEITNLETLRDEMKDAIGAKESEEKEVKRLEARLTQEEKKHQSLLKSAPNQIGVLDLLIRLDADSLSTAFATAEQAIALASEKLEDMLADLTFRDTVFSKVPKCLVEHSTMDELSKQYADLREKLKRADDSATSHQEDVDVKTAQIGHLKEKTGVINAEDSQKVRVERDDLWKSHLEKMNIETAKVFEPLMQKVDHIDAARISKAKELGELQHLEQTLVEAQTRLAANQRNIEDLQFQSQTIEKDVKELVIEVGLPEMTPSQFVEWLAVCNTAKEAQRNLDKLKKKHQDTIDKGARLLEDLLPFVELESPSFEAALDFGRRLANDERIHNDQLVNSCDSIEALSEELEGRRQDLLDYEKIVNISQENWKSNVQILFGKTLSYRILVSAIGQLREMREHDVKRLQAERQILAMESDQHQFSEKIIFLCNEFDVDEPDVDKAFLLLQNVVSKAQADQDYFVGLTEKISEDQKAQKAIELQLRNIDLQVTEYGAVFPTSANVSTIDDLRATVSKASDVIQTRIQIANLEKEIFDELSVLTISGARKMLGAVTASEIEAKKEILKTDVDSVEVRLSDATVSRANAERDLKALSGTDEIANLVEQRATLRLELEDILLSYVRKDFGLRLATEAIRRYRDKHRSGMMESTERAFSELTNGAYQKLLTQTDGSSETLLAVDARGTAKQIGDMSKGTRFQLYLALRAAAYEQMVVQGLQLPFFCDDVFETFDEERTSAACRLMERIGRSGQAIYLTHHRHVVEIAKEVCTIKPVVHEI